MAGIIQTARKMMNPYRWRPPPLEEENPYEGEDPNFFIRDSDDESD
jgi:hypothetical protein